MPLQPNMERRLGGMDHILRRAADIYPDRIAIDDRLRGVRMSYEDLRARATQLARALSANGVRKGDPVAYAFFNEHASIETLFACCMAGAVAAPLNNRLSPVEARDYLDRQECRVFIADQDLAGLGAGARVPLTIVRTRGGKPPAGALGYETLIEGHTAKPLPPAVSWEDPYMMAMTGGTTGGSKAAVWSHGGCLMDTLSVMVHMEVKRGCNTICLAPTYHAAGLGWGFLPVLWQGGHVIMPATTSFDPKFVVETLRREDIRYLLIVPAMIEPLHRVWDGVPIEGIQSMCIASAPTPEPLRRKLQSMFPRAHLVAGYGMTETFSMCIQTAGEFLAYPASVGEPSAVTRVRIVDDNGRQLPRGQTGHILGRTMAMSLYYNNDPENTRASFNRIDGDTERLEWMATGDVGFMDEEGRVTIVDRAKDIVITGGENVASVEVETVLLDDSRVRECAVIGLPDPVWGERLVAVLVKAGDQHSDEAVAREALAACRARLAGYKVPKQIAFLSVLPRSPFGKVLKREIVKLGFDRIFDATRLEEKSARV